MLYAYIPENIENLDLSQNFSINELQTPTKKWGRLPASAIIAQAGSRYLIGVQQRHMVTLLHGDSLRCDECRVGCLFRLGCWCFAVDVIGCTLRCARCLRYQVDIAGQRVNPATQV